MRTTLYLIRHAATGANLAKPALLQGRGTDLSLAPLGRRQAAATRDFFVNYAIEVVLSSPLQRAVETAEIIAGPHNVETQTLEDLTECDVGAWEGLDWETICAREPEAYRQFMSDPAAFGYPGGESFADVHRRAGAALDRLLFEHAGKTLLVVSHHIVNRSYLADLLGLPLRLARKIALDNCGISIVEREGEKTAVTTVNSVFHLSGLTSKNSH